VSSTLIPTGVRQSVAGTPFDFRTSKPIGSRINAKNTQLTYGKGYDHNYVLNGRPGTLRLAARVTEPTSGRVMRVYTTEPGLQFYSGNFLTGAQGKNGQRYPFRSGFCLEAQHFPDAPNQPRFASTVLRPGGVYRQTTVYQFATR
jgi:aldose 1-epimerase